MICPKCGFVDKNIPTPEITRIPSKLGCCNKCKCVIFANPTTKKTERSQAETVEAGEAREEKVLIPVYLKYHPGFTSKKRDGADDIDREILNHDGKIAHFLEIKERSNSLNAYKHTQFPYAKITTAEELSGKFNLPVIFIIKFTDCWARHACNPRIEYKKGSKPFAPQYRPSQYSKQRQIPVMIDVDTLEILLWRDLCD